MEMSTKRDGIAAFCRKCGKRLRVDADDLPTDATIICENEKCKARNRVSVWLAPRLKIRVVLAD